MKEKPLNNYFVDFDQTICNSHFNAKTGVYEMGEPMPYMLEALKNCNKEITIFTARPEKEHQQVRDWLDKYEVKYTEVTNIKRPALAYVDDRAMLPSEFVKLWQEK